MSTSPHSALITGAGSGIGRAIAERFIAEGWRVIAVGRRSEPLQNLADNAPPLTVLPLACDVRSEIDIMELHSRIENDAVFGSTLKVLVNNAGIFERKPFAETSDRLWFEMFETNLFGPVRLTRSLLPILKSNQGCIINISSTLGLRTNAGTSAYSASKAAMNRWTESLAIELGPEKVRANAVCPGIIETPILGLDPNDNESRAKLGKLQPLGRIGQPSDIANAVWNLAGPGSEWITGALFKVDGGIDLV